MKKTLILLATFLYGMSSAIAQNNCSKYYPLEEGSTFQYTIYNKKGKEDGTTDYSVTNVNNSSGQTSATFKMQYTDSKGKNSYNSEYDITCTGGGIKIDYLSILPKQMITQYEDMGVEMDITGTDIELPNDLSVGQKLNDANVACSINMSGIKMNINVDMVNRQVAAKESVTTPAGTFDCYVLTETSKSKTMGANIEMQSKMWLAEGIGMVKQEMSKKNGDLMSRTELSKYNN